MTRVAVAILRCERLLWALLVFAGCASLASLQHLELAFGFKSVMRAGHPDRERLEAYEREFQLGDSLFVYLDGPQVFTAAGLRAIRDLSGQIERVSGVQRVFSAVDVLQPAARDDVLRLVPLLGADTLASEERTKKVLSEPPFSDRWAGYLYDKARTAYVLIVRPEGQHEDPRLTLGALERIEEKLEDFRKKTGISYHLNGLFYLTGEMVRSTFRDQGKLTALGISLLVGCFWALFGSFWLALVVMLVLGASILLAFGVMVLLGVPLNGLSGNLPVLTLVNGLEDVVHLLVAFFAVKPRTGSRRAAAMAIRDCMYPNFLTSLTTFGALIVTAATDMVLLQAFGWAICIGVIVEYAVAIVFLPLVLQRMEQVSPNALYYRLDESLKKRWTGPWFRAVRSRANFLLWTFACAALVIYSSGQELNSNWYRYFVESHPVSRTLEFLDRKDFPVTTIDCTIPARLRADQMFGQAEIDRDLQTLSAAIASLPGVMRVDSWYDLKSFIEQRLAKLTFEPGLSEVWQKARREALFRQYLELGAFDEYYAASSQKLRLVISTDIEDANGLLDLSRRIEERVRTLKLERLRGQEAVISGTMAYWGVIMNYVSKTFFGNVAYTVAFIYIVFLWTIRRAGVATIAMIPNVMPIFVMFSTARFLGYDLNESFCVLDSLAIGNSVNDTVHYLFHVEKNLKRGLSLPDALREGFREVGCAMIISSLLVAIGFLACIGAEGMPVILSGVYMAVACTFAVALDVFFHPAMLLRLGRWR